MSAKDSNEPARPRKPEFRLLFFVTKFAGSLVLGGLQPCTFDPLENSLILPAILIALPPLAPVVRGVIIGNIPTGFCGVSRLHQNEAVARITDVDHPHGIFVIYFAHCREELALFIGRRE